LGHAINEATNSNADAVVVVFGKDADLFKKEIDEKKIRVAINSSWEEGMASSDSFGIRYFIKR
jgi:CTP:molybdopterin cytidylyltransferase MocA